MTLNTHTLPESVKTVRHEIDQLDRTLHDLLCQRFELVQQLAIEKRQPNSHITQSYIPEREQEILARHASEDDQAEYQLYIHHIYQALFAATRRIQQRYAIAVYAPSAVQNDTFSAALQHFGDYHLYTELTDFSGLFDRTQNGDFDYVVLEQSAYSALKAQCESWDILETLTLNCRNKHFYVLAPTLTGQHNANT